MKTKMNRFFLLIFCLITISAKSQAPLLFNGNKVYLQDKALFLEDNTGKLTAQEARSAFESGKGVPGSLDNGYVHVPLWVAIKMVNNSPTNRLMLTLENPLVDSAELFLPSDTFTTKNFAFLGDGYHARPQHGSYIKFVFEAGKQDTITLLLRVRNTEQMLLPISISEEKWGLASTTNRNLIYGIFIGVILIMFFYNLFLFVSTKDLNYAYYIGYILFIGLGQITLSGHLFTLVTGSFPYLHKMSIVVLPAVSGIGAVLFIQHFLMSKENFPGLHKALWVILVSYALAAIVRLLGQYQISARMMDSIGMPGAILVYILAIKTYKNGYKPARFFILAWTIFIAGVVLFVMRNLGVLPFNLLTTYTLPVGAALEVALLSFALADKINTLQAEKADKEKQVVEALLENERLIKEQNVILEHKVKERTAELYESNNQLSKALTDLKNTQTQLVDQEKMASLGQLTAGIAHEINNPINFVTSNINPLKRDISMIMDYTNKMEEMVRAEPTLAPKLKELDDMKTDLDYDYLLEELQFLMKGIDEGAHRTAEIVKGLRIFARQDEDTLLNADLVEGVESTLVILNNQLGKIKVERNLPKGVMIDCYPGKLNQVFLNLLSNAIYAINAKFHGENGGEIIIQLTETEEEVILSFSDNGVGMSEDVQKKVFEPFFTTKPVGEGTGLGMSIVFKTIEMHQGKILLQSKVGEGTKFEIHLKRSLIYNKG